VLYAEDEKHNPIVTWVNYAMHLDTVGGTLISSDYAYYLARTLAAQKGPDMLTTFTIGAAGDINHWDVQRPGPQRGFETAQKLGEALGGDVIKAYTHLQTLDPVRVKALSETIELPLTKITSQEVEEAEKIVAQPPPMDVDFTLDRVQAEKVVHVYKLKGENPRAEIQVLTIGPVAFVAIPGEYFVELGMRIKKESPFPYTFIVELANGVLGYIPTRRGYTEGGYEPTSTLLGPGSNRAFEPVKVEKEQNGGSIILAGDGNDIIERGSIWSFCNTAEVLAALAMGEHLAVLYASFDGDSALDIGDWICPSAPYPLLEHTEPVPFASLGFRFHLGICAGRLRHRYSVGGDFHRSFRGVRRELCYWRSSPAVGLTTFGSASHQGYSAFSELAHPACRRCSLWHGGLPERKRAVGTCF
jgi:hypothetical protein